MFDHPRTWTRHQLPSVRVETNLSAPLEVTHGQLLEHLYVRFLPFSRSRSSISHEAACASASSAAGRTGGASAEEHTEGHTSCSRYTRGGASCGFAKATGSRCRTTTEAAEQAVQCATTS